MSIEFIDNNNITTTLNHEDIKCYLKWDKEAKNYIKIKNIGKLFCLIFLKIGVAKDKLVVYKESVSDTITLQPDILYAFRIPTETWEFNITDDIGYDQMIGAKLSFLIDEKIDNFSIYKDVSATEFISYPPKYSYKSVNSIYKRDIYNSLELMFNSTIDENYFVYFIYHGNTDKKILVNYNLMLYLEIEEKIEFLDSNNNVISFTESNSSVLIQIIKKSQKNESLLYLEDNYISYGNSYEALSSYLFNDISDFYYFEFNKTQESIFLFNEANTLSPYSYDPINDNVIRGKFTKQENNSNFDYNFDFKPLENTGDAEYYVYLFNSSYNYTDLTNYYYLYTQIFDKYIPNKKLKITSTNGSFPEDAKNNFTLHIENKDNFEYYVAIIARQIDSYHAFKFYPAIKLLKNAEEDNKEIYLDKEIYEKTKTFDFVLNKNKKLNLLINNKEKYNNGKLLIQWQNDSPTKYSHLTIYKGIEDNSLAIANINSNEIFFYSLNLSEVEEKFKISYTLNDEEEKNVKIYLFYIPITGRKAYSDTEINFNYKSTVILPYFINPEKTNGKFEIFGLKYNDDKIKRINIKADFIDVNGVINGSNYLDIFDIKKTDREDYKFIQIKNENKGEISTIALEIELVLKQDLEINDKLEVFTIKRIESFSIDNLALNEFNEFQTSIEANSEFKFYLFNISSNLNNDKNALIVYTSLLQKTKSRLYNGNFFNPNLIPDTIDNSINILDLKENDFITFVSYNKEKAVKGFISLSLRELNKYEIVSEKNRNVIYNQELTFDKRGKGNHYYIINNNNKNEGKKSLTFRSSLNDTKLFDIKFYYLNDISKLNEFHSIEKNLEKNTLKLGENNVNPGEIEIFGYSYFIDEKVDKEIAVSIFTGDAKEKKGDTKSNKSILFIILICLGCILILGIVIIVILKCKKKTSKEIEGIDSKTSEPILAL